MVGAGSEHEAAAEVENGARPVALVTGASGGIGSAIARRLARAGYAVALAGRRLERLEKLAAELGAGTSVHAIDLTAETATQRLVDEVLAHHGRLDLLVSNAGIGGGGGVLRAQAGDWERAIAVNLTAAMRLAHAGIAALQRSPQGCVIHIASISASVSSAGSEAYAASKAGMVAFSRCLFESVRESGVKICAISPGFVDTELATGKLDRAKLIQPSDVAEAVVYVASSSPSCCPTEIVLRPQRNPYIHQ